MLAVAEREREYRKNRLCTNPALMQIVLNDLDPGVAAFWSLVAESDDEEYASFRAQCEKVEITNDYFDYLKAFIPTTRLEQAFRFFILNRTCRIESNGKRKLGNILSRWTPDRLLCEMDDARALLRGRTTVYCKDYVEVLALADENWTLYLDPPYVKQGNALYTEFQFTDAQHIQLRDTLAATPARWVLSYDMHPLIEELYAEFTIHTREVHYDMKKRKGIEAIILPNK